MSDLHDRTIAPWAQIEHRAIVDALELLSSAVMWLGGPRATGTMEIPASVLRAPRSVPARTPELSPREREVAALMGNGCSNRQIAATLSISIATVERHASNIYNKLGFHSRSQVAVWAVLEGLALPVPG
jgi:DNA-binding NarL/FixJ family response regulator